MLYLAMVLSACMTQLLGWVYVLPLCIFGLIQIKFGDYLNKETISNSIPKIALALKSSPIDTAIWLVGLARGYQTQPQETPSKSMKGAPDTEGDAAGLFSDDAWNPPPSRGMP